MCYFVSEEKPIEWKIDSQYRLRFRMKNYPKDVFNVALCVQKLLGNIVESCSENCLWVGMYIDDDEIVYSTCNKEYRFNKSDFVCEIDGFLDNLPRKEDIIGVIDENCKNNN